MRVMLFPHDFDATTSGVSENQNVPASETWKRSRRKRIAVYSPFRAPSSRPTPMTPYCGSAAMISSIWKSSASCRPDDIGGLLAHDVDEELTPQRPPVLAVVGGAVADVERHGRERRAFLRDGRRLRREARRKRDGEDVGKSNHFKAV